MIEIVTRDRDSTSSVNETKILLLCMCEMSSGIFGLTGANIQRITTML